eukprot:5438287-Pyramimonas_sp.AAC.1
MRARARRPPPRQAQPRQVLVQPSGPRRRRPATSCDISRRTRGALHLPRPIVQEPAIPLRLLDEDAAHSAGWST